ncbi:MAG: hypothetical protein QM647_07040 [Asticcacaulis sp.]|uniref:hypothetical protein n=1 Tax=Asticcacaulis sp. TaxID=1872648 RepID=UPI0039E713DB
MRTATVEDDLPKVSPAIAILSGFIMVCLALLVFEIGYMTRDHADAAPQSAQPHTDWRSLTQ